MYTRPGGSNRTRYESGPFGSRRQTEDEDTPEYYQPSEWSANTNEYQYPSQATPREDDTSFSEESYTGSQDYGNIDEDIEERGERNRSDEDDLRSNVWQGGEPNASSSSHAASCTCLGCGRLFPSISQKDRHYRTIHANNGERPYKCEVGGCQADVTSWTRAAKLRLHNKQWHGPYPCQAVSCSRRLPNGFGTQSELDAHTAKVHYEQGFEYTGSYASPTSSAYVSSVTATLSGSTKDIENPYAPSWQPDMLSYLPSGATSGYPSDPGIDNLTRKMSSAIISDNPRTTYHPLDKNYKLHPSFSFKWGRVFKVLWEEPAGNAKGGTEITVARKTESFHKIRRFIIVKENRGHALCLPIMTYTGRGTLKTGVHPEHHTIVYSRGEEPIPFDGEKKRGLTKKPIEIRMEGHEKLDPASRLNYAKIYTVEHNIKVFFVGRVSPKSEWQLTADFNQTHPPLKSRGVAPSHSGPRSFKNNEYSYAEPTAYAPQYYGDSSAGSMAPSAATSSQAPYPQMTSASSYSKSYYGDPPSQDESSLYDA